EDSDLAAVFQYFETYPITGFSRWIINRNIGCLYRRFFLNNATSNTQLWVRFLMLFDHLNTGHDQSSIRKNAIYFTALAFIATSNHDYFVITFNFSHYLTLNSDAKFKELQAPKK